MEKQESKDSQENPVPEEEKPPPVKKTNLKEFTLDKFKLLEPKIEDNFDDLSFRIKKLEDSFMEKLESQQ